MIATEPKQSDLRLIGRRLSVGAPGEPTVSYPGTEDDLLDLGELLESLGHVVEIGVEPQPV
jgi:hypothetical protein